MLKKEDLRQLIEESKQIFVRENIRKLNENLAFILEHRLYKNEGAIQQLEMFFHSLKGSAATLELSGIAELALKFEDLIVTVHKTKEYNAEFYSYLLEGMALINEQLVTLSRLMSNSADSSSTIFVGDTNVSELDQKKNILIKNGKEEVFMDENSKIDDLNEAALSINQEQTKKKILLIEDVNVISHVVQVLLESSNYDVVVAKDGEEGIRLFHLLNPDLIIVDLMMPKVDGFEVCRLVQESGRKCKVVIMSSRKNRDDVLRCFKLGIDDYIVKPFLPEELLKRICNLLE